MMRRFVLDRLKDSSEFSGTGIVVEGIEFTNGQVALIWLGEYPSIVIWPNIEMMIKVHGHGDDTHIVWVD